jgi:hypothetical protein
LVLKRAYQTLVLEACASWPAEELAEPDVIVATEETFVPNTRGFFCTLANRNI